MRNEEIIAKALEKLDYDRYQLSVLLFARVKELGLGAKPLIEIKGKHSGQLSDIALMEIAEGKIKFDRIDKTCGGK